MKKIVFVGYFILGILFLGFPFKVFPAPLLISNTNLTVSSPNLEVKIKALEVELEKIKIEQTFSKEENDYLLKNFSFAQRAFGLVSIRYSFRKVVSNPSDLGAYQIETEGISFTPYLCKIIGIGWFSKKPIVEGKINSIESVDLIGNFGYDENNFDEFQTPALQLLFGYAIEFKIWSFYGLGLEADAALEYDHPTRKIFGLLTLSLYGEVIF